MRIFLAILTCLLLASCKTPFPNRATVLGETFSVKELKDCERLHGHIEQVGLIASTCVYPAPDAGRSCLDSSECAGRCDAPVNSLANQPAVGSCSAIVGRLGCSNVVVQGKATGDICAD